MIIAISSVNLRLLIYYRLLMGLLGKWSSQRRARDGKKPADRGRPRSVSAPAILTSDQKKAMER